MTQELSEEEDESNADEMIEEDEEGDMMDSCSNRNLHGEDEECDEDEEYGNEIEEEESAEATTSPKFKEIFTVTKMRDYPGGPLLGDSAYTARDRKREQKKMLK